MTKSKPTREQEEEYEEALEPVPVLTDEVPAQEAYPLDADGNPPAGAFLPGYRSALDNPAHPLHYLRDA
jgi:hypothetical protein